METVAFYLGLRASLERKQMSCAAGCGDFLPNDRHHHPFMIGLLRRGEMREVCGGCATKYAPTIARLAGIRSDSVAGCTLADDSDGAGRSDTPRFELHEATPITVEEVEVVEVERADVHQAPVANDPIEQLERLIAKQEGTALKHLAKRIKKLAPRGQRAKRGASEIDPPA